MKKPRMPFDVDQAVMRLWLLAGGNFSQDGVHPDVKEEHQEMSWESVPFLKALCEVGRNHREELEAEWRKALTEPMPFGCAPLGADYHPAPEDV